MGLSQLRSLPRCRLVLAGALHALILFFPTVALPQVVTIPAGLRSGDRYRLIFTTSAGRDATSANIADYDAFVTAAANAVPPLSALRASWRAIISTPTINAIDRVGSLSSPIYRVDGVLFSPGNILLRQTQLNVNEWGTPMSDSDMWTGSDQFLMRRGGYEAGTKLIDSYYWCSFPEPPAPCTVYGNKDSWAVGISPSTWTQHFAPMRLFALSSELVVPVAQSTCVIPDLPPITDQLAQDFERYAPSPPVYSLYFPYVNDVLDFSMSKLEAESKRYGLPALSRQSGFRWATYQQHFYEIKLTDAALQDVTRKDPGQMAACVSLRQAVDAEIAKHEIVRSPNDGLLQVANPLGNKSARHIVVPAEALDISSSTLSLRRWSPVQLGILDLLASNLALHRPYPVSDRVHFESLLVPSTSGPRGHISATVQSPVDILVRDPLGRRVGFDPRNGAVINEIGAGAFYSGRNTEPQFIDIGSVVAGTYIVSGIGVGDGPYRLTIQRFDDDGDILDVQSQSGTVSRGQTVSAIMRSPIYVPIDIKPEDSSNVVNPRNRGNIPVAILSAGTFFAPDVLQASIRFGKRGDEQSLERAIVTDVNGDGTADVLCHFNTQSTGFQEGDTQGILSAATTAGIPLVGRDWVRLVLK